MPASCDAFMHPLRVEGQACNSFLPLFPLEYTHGNPSALTLLKLVDTLLGRAVSVGSIPMLRVRVYAGGPELTVGSTLFELCISL